MGRAKSRHADKMTDEYTRPPLMPADTPDYMAPAWIGCIHWAIGDADILAAFRAETGNTWTPARNGLDMMIDQATVVDRKFIEQFIQWVNINIWGSIHGNNDEEGE